MHFQVLTIFPELLQLFRQTGVLGRAVQQETISLEVHDLRAWSGNRWSKVDDEPYGGGAGMVMCAPPLLAAVRELCGHREKPRVLLLSPRGRVLDQPYAEELAAAGQDLLLVCGRYEGFDERAVEILQETGVHSELVSLGDFVLGGGEIAAMAVIEAVARLIPGVVGDPDSVAQDSFTSGLLDYPCYTRPPEVEGRQAPAVLLSGNHELIRRWRLAQAIQLTVTLRPDLVRRYWETYDDEVRSLIRKHDATLAASCSSECPDSH